MDISKSTQEIVQNEDVSGESDHTPPNAQRLALVHEEASPHLHSKTWMIVLTMSCIQFALLIQLVATGAFASSVALVVGGSDISGWMLTALTITFVVFAPPVSQAADYWGRRWILIILCLLGFVGVMITGRASSMSMAIAGEVFVGAAFASTPLTFAVSSEVLPHKHRLTGQAALNVAGGLGAVFSLLLGAGLINNHGPDAYRIVYYIDAGIFIAAAIITFLLYRPPPRELQMSLTTREKVQKLDWIGYGIVLCATVLFVMGLSWASNPYPWSNTHVLVPFITGTILFGVLAIYSWKFRKDGILNHDLFSRDRNFALSMASIFCEGLIFGTVNVYTPFQFGVSYGYSAWKAPFAFSTTFMIYAAVSPVGAIICLRYKQVQSLIVAGFVCFIIYAVCMATTSLTDGAATWGYLAFVGTGLSLVLCAVVTAAQLSAPPELISITSGILSALRSLGVTVSVAIGAAIFHGKISKLLPEMVTAAALSNGLPKTSVKDLIVALSNQDEQALAKIPGLTPQIIGAAVVALKKAYLKSFHAVWYPAIAFAVIGLICSLAYHNPAKDLNNRIDAPVESEEALYGVSGPAEKT